MPYYMTHPKHGRTVVYDLSEVERVKAYGWSLLEPCKSCGQVVGHYDDCEVGMGGTVGSLGSVRAIPASPDSFRVPEAAKRKPGRPPKAK